MVMVVVVTTTTEMNDDDDDMDDSGTVWRPYWYWQVGDGFVIPLYKKIERPGQKQCGRTMDDAYACDRCYSLLEKRRNTGRSTNKSRRGTYCTNKITRRLPII